MPVTVEITSHNDGDPIPFQPFTVSGTVDPTTGTTMSACIMQDVNRFDGTGIEPPPGADWAFSFDEIPQGEVQLTAQGINGEDSGSHTILLNIE